MRKIIVEGNSVYEVDEEALMKKRSENNNHKSLTKKEGLKNIAEKKQEKKEKDRHVR